MLSDLIVPHMMRHILFHDKKMAIHSLKEIFTLYTDELYIEAREVTVNMLLKFGCKVIGETEDFYGEPITPILLNKEMFDNHLNNLGFTK